MTDQRLYSPQQAAKAAGISVQSLRNYTDRYKDYLSPHAVPEPGQTRWFAPRDIAILAYINDRTTRENMTHQQLLEALAEDHGVLDGLEPIEPADPVTDSSATSGGDLMSPQMLRAYELLVSESRRRERDAEERAAELQRRLEELSRELGEAKGALSAYQRLTRRPGWWKHLFGGE